jgi:RNA methyltransferase, TrmH family
VVEGPTLVVEALRSGWAVESIYVDAAAEAGWYATPGLDDPTVGRAPVAVLAGGVIDRVATTTTPQPVLAVVERRVASIDVLDTLVDGFVLVVDRLADPGNAGTVLRSAEAAGVDAVVCTPGTVDVFNPKVVRASAGALFHVPIVVDVPLAEVRRPGWRLVGTTSHGGPPFDAESHDDMDIPQRLAVVLGNEAHGLDADVDVDGWVTVPHVGRSESLNVAMAATVIAFEVARRRRGR